VKILSLAVAVLGLAGCAQPADHAPVQQEEAGSTVLLDSAREPLDRARQVEDLTGQRKAELDEAIDSAGDQ